jgi:membrane protein required for colicin V production
MTALDIIVLLLIGGNGVIGARRGFVCEVLSVAALVAAIMAVRLFHAPVADLLSGFIGTRSGAATLAFALLFGLTWYGGKYAAGRIGGSARRALLGSFDRILGFGFGALKGLLFATVAFVGFTLLYDTLYGGDARRPDWMRQSRTYPLLNASGKAMSAWLDERRRSGGLIGTSGADDKQSDKDGQ